jgi:hypothetical protein
MFYTRTPKLTRGGRENAFRKLLFLFISRRVQSDDLRKVHGEPAQSQ